MNPEQLRCHDCAHSRANFLTRVTRTSFGYRCNLDWKEPRVDKVTGRTQPGYYAFCSSTRCDSAICGFAAKAWTPRTKKDIFTLLKVQR